MPVSKVVVVVVLHHILAEYHFASKPLPVAEAFHKLPTNTIVGCIKHSEQFF